MPRPLRIEKPGYHLIYNQALDKKHIFKNDEDKDMFLEILIEVCQKYKVKIHSYAILNSDYYLLAQNEKENLSLAMRLLSSKYVVYFNKKYKRKGPLWQSRFKSWYIVDEVNLPSIYRYIESTPITSKLEKDIGEYVYSSSYGILRNFILECIKDSFVLKDFNLRDFEEFISAPITQEEKDIIKKVKATKLKVVDDEITKSLNKSIESYFEGFDKKKEKQKRDSAILKAFYDGHKQVAIANFLGVSVSLISKVIKKLDNLEESFVR